MSNDVFVRPDNLSARRATHYGEVVRPTAVDGHDTPVSLTYANPRKTDSSDHLTTVPIRTLQTRILAFFLLLTVVVQVGAFVLINTVGGAAARKSIGEELVAGARVFDRLLEQDTQRLAQGARLLSSDYAFRESIATGAGETIVSMLANHGRRIDADLMMIIGLDQRVVADTLGVSTGQIFAFPRLLAEAESE